MKDITDMRYDYLSRRRFTVHQEQEPMISENTLHEIGEYETFEFYSQEKLRKISREEANSD